MSNGAKPVDDRFEPGVAGAPDHSWCAGLTLTRDPVLLDFTGLKGKIVIYGGSFDPPHPGHLSSALSAGDFLQSDKVVLMPCWTDESKPGIHASPQERVDMVALMIQAFPGLCVSPFELQQSRAPYTIDTLAAIRRLIDKDAELIFLVGSDALQRAHSWHRIDEYFDFCEIKMVGRHGKSYASSAELEGRYNPDTLSRLKQSVIFSDDPEIEFSSSNIRQAISAGRMGDIMDSLSAAVAEYIAERRLYLP